MDFQAKRRSTVAGEKEPIDALVLLSSHTGMFGDLGPRVVARYIEEVTTHKGDAYVIGENGAKMVYPILSLSLWICPTRSSPQPHLAK